MKSTRIFLFSFCLFLISFDLAAANISIDANSPTDPQPFSIYCAPYTYAFQDNHHYKLVPNASCTYALPLAGSRILAMYEGRIGSSTRLSFDNYDGPATVVHTSQGPFANTFLQLGIPQQDQNFFAVVYDTSLGADFENYLSSGGAKPIEAVRDTNYWILNWQWGSVPVSEYEPVIIIPGILGSWQKDGAWVIDPVGHTYDNLIDTFKANGYVLGKTLYPFAYNWESSNTTTAKLLEYQIQSIKAKCSCSHVDIIAHSMGGLVARQYLEGPTYHNDIDQLIFVATPQLGAPAAYSAWEAGSIDFGKPVINSVLNRIFTNEAKENKYKDIFSYIQGKPVISVKELLPIYNYLLAPTFKTYPTGYPQNTFLDYLRTNFSGWHGARITSISADDRKQDTVSRFLTIASTQLPMWQDGMPTTTFKSFGDGMVPNSSIENFLPVVKKYLDTDHPSVVSTSTAYVFEVLNNRPPSAIINNSYPFYKADWKLLFIKLFSPIDMQIIAPNGKKLGKDFANNSEIDEIPDAFYSGFNTSDEYAVIVDPQPGTYTIKTIGTGAGGSYTIGTDLIDPSGDIEANINGTTTPGQVTTFSLAVSPETHSIDIKQSDTDPPKITISSPSSRAVYLKSSTIFVNANIEDQSALSTTTYWLNNIKINPLQAMPLSSASTPSMQTISVSASDIYGNTATTSTSFYIVKSKATCAADLVTYLQLVQLPTPISTEVATWAINACMVLK